MGTVRATGKHSKARGAVGTTSRPAGCRLTWLLSTKRLGPCCRSSPHRPSGRRPVREPGSLGGREATTTHATGPAAGWGAARMSATNQHRRTYSADPAVNRPFTCADTHLRRSERVAARKRFDEFTDNLDFSACHAATRRPPADRSRRRRRARRRRRGRWSRRPAGPARRPPSPTGSGCLGPPPAPELQLPAARSDPHQPGLDLDDVARRAPAPGTARRCRTRTAPRHRRCGCTSRSPRRRTPPASTPRRRGCRRSGRGCRGRSGGG